LLTGSSIREMNGKEVHSRKKRVVQRGRGMHVTAVGKVTGAGRGERHFETNIKKGGIYGVKGKGVRDGRIRYTGLQQEKETASGSGSSNDTN